MNFNDQYNYYLNKINNKISELYSIPNLIQKNVFSAMNYAICANGKRIRPVLTMAVCDMFGGDLDDAVMLGCAIESIHNYSLIHDDLPCMDNDSLRRGRPTCHVAYEENIALLAGDALLNNAFELLSDIKNYRTLDAVGLLQIIRTVSDASGAYGMIGGQVIDLENEHKDCVTKEELINLHRLKTGELIRISAECGCICAGITDTFDERYGKLVDFSTKLGLAFQIKDDILDVVGNQELLGKPVGSDAKSQKNTFVTLLGLKNAEKELDILTQSAKDNIKELRNSDFLIKFADYLLNRSC